MLDSDTVGQIRAELDEERWIEGAAPEIRRYVEMLERENARLGQELLELRESTRGRQKGAGGGTRQLSAASAQVATVRYPDGFDAIRVSEQAKIIRSEADEVPAKTGAVQGVHVMDCRGDNLTALAVVGPPASLR